MIIVPPPKEAPPTPATISWIWGKGAYHCHVGWETPMTSLCGRQVASSWETKTPGSGACHECRAMLLNAFADAPKGLL